MQVFVVQLDKVERRADLTVLLNQGQYRGIGHLFGFHVCGLRLCAAPVPTAFLNVTDHCGSKLYGCYAVDKILVHFFSCIKMMIVVNIPDNSP